MDKSRTEIKVGLFVLVGLVLIAGAMFGSARARAFFAALMN